MDEEYLGAVLDVVAAVPPGRVMTYGTVAEVVADAAVARGGRPRGGPRQVGRVLALAGSGVPWWRVVAATGLPPAAHAGRALARLRAEGTPLTPDGRRVVVARALWWPDDAGEVPTDPRGRPGDGRPGDGAPDGDIPGQDGR